MHCLYCTKIIFSSILFSNFFSLFSFRFVDVTTEDGSDVVYYVIMIIGPLFIISLVILLIILHKRGICKKCKRKISKSNTVGSQEIIMAPPPEKIVPLYFDDPIQREKTDVISVFEFNTT